MTDYLPRLVDAELASALRSSGAVVVDGARAVGKTETARQVARSELRLDANDARAVLAREQPETALQGASPRLLDEWQLVPELWNAVRREVDDRREPGQFILTGSAVPDDDALRHPGAGRFRRVTMRTLSCAESGHSSAEVSLAGLFAGEIALAESPLPFEAVVTRIVIGGWPGWFGRDEAAATAAVRAYLTDIAHHDFALVAGPRRDPRRMMAYLDAVAALVAHPASMAAISRRMNEASTVQVGPLAAPTAHDLANRLFLVEDQPAWSPRLRSRTAAAATPTVHLADPSLAAALLGCGSERLLTEPATLGFLMESLVVHDLRVYADAMGARGVFHYRDSKGRDEIDAIVEAADGRWIGFEVKLGSSRVDEAAANLLRVAGKIERAPSALVVVTPTGVAHRRRDGVLVVPLTTLGA